jgi:hypothetical protein
MADEDENLVVDLNEPDPDDKDEAQPPINGVAAKPPPVPGPSAAPPPQAGLEALQQQMQNERAARERAQQETRRLQGERDQAVAFAQEAERRGVSTYELYNQNQIQSTQEAMESLAAQHEVALADGDFKRASALQLKIGRLGGNLAVLERDQVVLQQQRENMAQQAQQPSQQPQPQQQPQVPTDPFERAIHGRSEPTKAFLRKHPDLVRSDGSLKKIALDSHEGARDAGHQVDTPGYFQYIEQMLGGGQGAPAQGGRGAAPPLARPPTMAAPVSHGASPGSPVDADGRFTITPKMKRLAEEQGVTPKEWARNYVRLLSEGRITPIS